MPGMNKALTDLRLVFRDSLSDGYEMSKVLLASAGFDGTLQLLTSGWERALGYGREELNAKTLVDILWSDRRAGGAAVAAILDKINLAPVHLRVRCRNGRGKRLKLNRLYDKRAHVMHIVAEEVSDKARVLGERKERRMAARHA